MRRYGIKRVSCRSGFHEPTVSLTAVTTAGNLKLMAKSNENGFEFVGAIFKERDQYVSLCLDLDVASQGATVREAKRMLAEAVTLYLEGCFESNVPYLRPVPREEDPRFNPPPGFVSTFPLKVAFQVHAVA